MEVVGYCGHFLGRGGAFDLLAGNDGADVLRGGVGDAVLRDGPGDDVVLGGPGQVASSPIATPAEMTSTSVAAAPTTDSTMSVAGLPFPSTFPWDGHSEACTATIASSTRGTGSPDRRLPIH